MDRQSIADDNRRMTPTGRRRRNDNKLDMPVETEAVVCQSRISSSFMTASPYVYYIW